jgi:hypothetical protein
LRNSSDNKSRTTGATHSGALGQGQAHQLPAKIIISADDGSMCSCAAFLTRRTSIWVTDYRFVRFGDRVKTGQVVAVLEVLELLA